MRSNVSALVRRAGGGALVVDMGKTARPALAAAIRAHRLAAVDAIVLTHGHADAMLGLDDVRDLQWTGGVMPVWASAATLAVTRQAFPYLHPPPDTPAAAGGAGGDGSGGGRGVPGVTRQLAAASANGGDAAVGGRAAGASPGATGPVHVPVVCVLSLVDGGRPDHIVLLRL